VFCIDRVVIEGAASGEMRPSVGKIACNKPAVEPTGDVNQGEPDDCPYKKLIKRCEATMISIRSLLKKHPEETLKEFGCQA